MKNHILPFAALGLLFAASACDDDNDLKKDPDQPQGTYQLKGEIPTCIIPEDESMPVVFSKTPVYTITRYDINNLWTVNVTKISLQGFGDFEMRTPEMMATSGYNRYLTYNSPFTSVNGDVINGFEACILSDYWYYTGENTIHTTPLSLLQYIYFNVPGKFSVHAFPTRVYYGGTTVSSYKTAEGQDKNFKSETPVFGVEMNLDSRTATVKIYNAKFADEMPAISLMTLSGLTVEGDRDHGYEIKGTDIIPVVGMGDGAVPYPNFIFNSFELHPSEDLFTDVECDFNVAGRFNGEFEGSCAR